MRSLHERVAEALGWTVGEAQSLSFQSLRELVRPVDAGLARELDSAIRSGSYIIGSRYEPRARKRGQGRGPG